MTRKLAPPLSQAGRQLQQQVSALVLDYETRLGPVPVWFAEIDSDGALRLIAACLRIGMRLPAEETLQVDTEERAKARWHFRNRGWPSPTDPGRAGAVAHPSIPTS